MIGTLRTLLLKDLCQLQARAVVFRSGNSVSTGALASLGFWGVDVVVETAKGRPVAMMKSFDDDNNVETRLAQYEAIHSEKGRHIAKQIVIAKISSQKSLLDKNNLRSLDLDKKINDVLNVDETDLRRFRQKLNAVEGARVSGLYFVILMFFSKSSNKSLNVIVFSFNCVLILLSS